MLASRNFASSSRRSAVRKQKARAAALLPPASPLIHRPLAEQGCHIPPSAVCRCSEQSTPTFTAGRKSRKQSSNCLPNNMSLRKYKKQRKHRASRCWIQPESRKESHFPHV